MDEEREETSKTTGARGEPQGASGLLQGLLQGLRCDGFLKFLSCTGEVFLDLPLCAESTAAFAASSHLSYPRTFLTSHHFPL